LYLLVFRRKLLRYIIAIPSVVGRLSVTFVHATQTVELFGNIFAPSNNVLELTQFVLKFWKEIRRDSRWSYKL